jgi:hypothetical protein
VSYEQRIIEFLMGRDGHTATQQAVLDGVEGKRTNLIETIEHLAAKKVVEVAGVKHSPTNPLTLKLKMESLGMNSFMNRFGSEN